MANTSHATRATARVGTLLLASALLAGCESSATTPVTVTVPPGAALVQLQTMPDSVIRAHYSGVKDRRRLVVRDAARWTALWNELTAQQQPRPPIPQVDFSREMIIFASMGRTSTGGYSIQVPRAHEAGGRLYAVVREVRPGPACIVTQAEGAPVVAVRVKQHSGEVLFVEESETRACG